MAHLLRPDGSGHPAAPAGRTFTLAEMYALVGCDMVEPVDLDDGRTMWIDEEGKYADPPKPVNAEATHLLALAGGIPGDVIVGNALITLPGEVD